MKKVSWFSQFIAAPLCKSYQYLYFFFRSSKELVEQVKVSLLNSTIRIRHFSVLVATVRKDKQVILILMYFI